jgi:iron complex outermembrane receptor protein
MKIPVFRCAGRGAGAHHKKTFRLVAALASGLIAISASVAADQAAPSSGELKQLSLEDLMNIQVTSVSLRPERLSSTPSAIQVITAEDIRRSGATSIPEALRLADNLDVARKSAHDWAITARGFNTSFANKLLVLIDGRTVYTPLFSGVLWDHQDYLLEDIDRIEVISGPGGTIWGANAVNGVINIVTKSARDTRGVYAEAGGGNQLEDFTGLRYGAELTPGVDFRVYGKTLRRGDEVLNNGSPGQDAWHMGQAGFRLGAQPSSADSLNLQGDMYGGNEGEYKEGAIGVGGGNVLGRWSHTLSEQSDMTLQAYYDRTHLSDPESALAITPLLIAPAGTLTDNLDTYDISFQHRFRWGERQRFVWGLGYRYTHEVDHNSPSVALTPPTLDQDLYSGFVQDEIAILDRLFFTLGSKLEHNAYTGYEVEPSARMQWSITDSQAAWWAISRAVRTPCRLDRGLQEPERTATIPYVLLEGSPSFRSETLVAYELGYRAQVGRSLTGSLSFYYNDYDHVRSVGFTPVTILPLPFQNNLQGETHGLELSLDYQAFEWWRLHAGYDALNEDLRVKPGQFDLNAALNETADPTQRVSLRSSMDLPHQVQVNASLRWIDSRKINSGSTFGVVPSYGEMDLRLAWHPIQQLELSMTGQNLLHDQHPEYGYPGPTQSQIRRAFYGKLQWRY